MFPKGPRQWITSPLGFNVLLSLLKENAHVTRVEKYKQVNKNGTFKTEFDSKTELVLANTCKIEKEWQTCGSSGPVMKLYNSFSYTQDIKYEARLLELPLQSYLKLMIVVPNEADVLRALFSTLLNQGQTAAVNSIQPLFTYVSNLVAPSIEINSRVQIEESIRGINGSTIQYGEISVNDKGARVNVLTCICSPAAPVFTIEETLSEPPFYFAIVFNDVPIFSGQFTQR